MKLGMYSKKKLKQIFHWIQMMVIMTNNDYCFKQLHIAVGLEIEIESF